MSAQNYKRDPNGKRLDFHGMDTVHPPDLVPEGKFVFAKNVRRYLDGAVAPRATQDDPIVTVADPIHSLRRLNDLTPAGPTAGFIRIIGAGYKLYSGATLLADGFSGNQLSLIPFRPNTSVQPWMYVGDVNKMVKVRSDNTLYKTGIKEPQTAPVVGTQTTSTSGAATLPATARPWSNVGGMNAVYNYGDTGDGTAPVIIATPVYGAKVTITVTGSATVNGATHAPGDAGPNTSNYPGQFITSPRIVVGAFTDESGNIVGTGSIPVVMAIGASATLTVPNGASQLQIGIDSQGGSFSSNSGSFTLHWTVATSAVATKVSILGEVTVYYWGDSPHSGPVSEYIWRNPNDTASGGPSRSTSNAAGSSTGTSFLFDTTPSQPAYPVQWTDLNSDGTVAGTKALFTPALDPNGYENFNCCIVANIFFPAQGTFNFTLVNKDNVMFGIGGGATWNGKGTTKGYTGQTETVVNALPLIPVNHSGGEGGQFATTNIPVTVPSAGVYPIEIDWDYWYHSGRTLTLKCNGADIPPLSSNVRTNVQYRYIFRSTATGAKSNPSPASSPQQMPVLANTISPGEYSSDPQVDVIDYFRMDSGLTYFTYVATGPNTNPPTAITDTALDTDVVSNPLLEYDNFEPFPSIDLPRKGVVNVSGGVISWVSGDQFNTRWLAGTVILIGSPTALAYTLIKRPASATTMEIPGVPDGLNLAYEITEPILAAQCLPYQWGPTDNVAFMFGCGDPLRPGTLYWTKGNNPDSAPDTNQQDVTSPSEPLQNGCIVNGIGMVFSSERAWLIYPNYFNALATVTGTQGATWSLQESISTRGLYIPTCLAVEGGKNVFFRAKDGVYASVGGWGNQSITDGDLYNLFPHEGYAPSPVTRGGYTIYPPDDTLPQKQKFCCGNGFLYYEYQGTDGNPYTLVYDIHAEGWVLDVYSFPVKVHYLEEGDATNTLLTGCTDGGVRTVTE